MKQKIYIAVGTNMGDRFTNIKNAIISFSPDVDVVNRSNIYETQPWGYLNQPAFLNMVIEGLTDLAPIALLDYLKKIETDMGRVPGIRNGPRLIDLDIIFYDNLFINTRNLTIPHPRMHDRAFVLRPLSDLIPDYAHPSFGKTVKELLQETDQSGIVKKHSI